jgi:hypothetical protein
MRRPARTVAGNLAARRPPFVDELHDGDGDGAEQEDVYEAFPAQNEFSHEPRGAERRGEQTDVQIEPNPFARLKL